MPSRCLHERAPILTRRFHINRLVGWLLLIEAMRRALLLLGALACIASAQALRDISSYDALVVSRFCFSDKNRLAELPLPSDTRKQRLYNVTAYTSR